MGWLLSLSSLVWGQERPPIQLPDVVIVGQEVRAAQEEKRLIQPRTMPIGLKSAVEAGKVAHVAPSDAIEVAGPTAENPGCLLFSGLGGRKDESMYKRGLRHYNKRNDVKARKLFTRVVRTYPKSTYRGAAMFWLGESYYRDDDDEKALKYYEDVVATYQREPLRDYALYRAAEIRLRGQHYEQAAGYLRTLRAGYPASPTSEYASYLTGEVAFRQERFAPAVEAFNVFLRRFPRSALRPRTLLLLAESLYRLRQYDAAQKGYQAFLTQYKMHPLAPEARYGLGWALLKQNDRAAAVRVFHTQQGIAPEPRIGEAIVYARLQGAIQRQDERGVQTHLQRLRQDYPAGTLMAAALSELAWARFAAKDYEEALRFYQQLLAHKQTPDQTRDVAQYMVGECLYQQSRYAQAAAAFRNIRRDAVPVLREKAAFRLGATLYHRREYAPAAQVLQAFVVRYAASPYRDEALFWLAETQFAQEAYRTALQTFGRLSPKGRLYDYALYGRGWTFMRLEQWSQAVQAFRQLVVRFPASAVRADALYRLGESLQQTGEREAAQQYFARYLTTYPQGALAPAAQLQLALLSGKEVGIEQTIEALRNVQQRFPGTPQAADAQYRLGETLFRYERFAQSRDAFETFVQTYPAHAKTVRARVRIADAHYNEKQFRAALTAYQKASILSQRSPLRADARYGVVLCHYQLAQYGHFLRETDVFIRAFPQHALSVSLLLQVAQYYQEHQQLQEAVQTYTRIVRDYKDSVQVDKARFRLGELYGALGETDKALETYELLLRSGHDTSLQADALFAQGQAYEASGKAPEAVERYVRIAEDYPEASVAARGLYQAGRVLQGQRKYRQAQQYFEGAVERYPANPIRFASWLQWGMTLLEQRQPARALPLLQQAQQAPAAHIAARAQAQIGRAHSLAGDLQQGINAFLRVAYLYPEEKTLVATAFRQAAQNYVKLGKCAEALKVYSKLLNQVSGQERDAIQQDIAKSQCQ